jgi:hypothetical protein
MGQSLNQEIISTFVNQSHVVSKLSNSVRSYFKLILDKTESSWCETSLL